MRYLAAGIGFAALNNVLLIGGDWSGLHYGACIALTFVVSVPLSYLVHARWTFRTSHGWTGFARYLGGSVSSLVIAAFAVWFFRGLLGLPMLAAAPLATVVMTVYNYIMARWAVRYSPKAQAQAFGNL